MFIKNNSTPNNKIGMVYNNQNSQQTNVPQPQAGQVLMKSTTKTTNSLPMIVNQPQKKGCRKCDS